MGKRLIYAEDAIETLAEHEKSNGHTGSRNINTEKELHDLLDHLPELYGIEQ